MAKMTLSRQAAFLAALVSVAVLFSGCASTADLEVRRLQARSSYEQALKNLAEKRISLGLASLRQAVELDPDNPMYRNAVGAVLLELRRPDEALAEFQKAVEMDPGFAEAHHNIGASHAEQGKWEEAITAYRKALSLPVYPSPHNSYNNLGYAYLALGKRREAEDAFRAALQLEPTLLPSHFWLGVVLYQEGRRDEAKAQLRAARDLDPASPFGQRAQELLKALGDGG